MTTPIAADAALIRAPVSPSSASGVAVRRAKPLGSFLLWLDLAVPLAVKVAVPVIAAIVLFVAGFLAIALPSLQDQLVDQYVAEARQVGMLVQEQYTVSGSDRVALGAALQSHVRVDPSVHQINVYRILSGSPVLWATSGPSELASDVPDPYDVEPLVTGGSLHRIESTDGVRVLETVFPIVVDGSVVASVGIYSTLTTVDATTTTMTRLVVVLTLVGAAVVAILVGLILQLAVLRPIGRLHRAALRVAAGDLSVRLPAGDQSPPRDEIARVSREFKHMVAAVAERRATAEAAAAQLHEEKLALTRANEELEALYRQQSRFVSVVSHEFRTPLTGIQGFSEILRDEDVTPAEVRDFGGDINREAKRLGRLIGDMLDLDRMRSGRMELRLQPVDLDEIVSEVAHDMAKLAASHPIVLRLGAAHARVQGDRDRLVQVVTNLLSNAVKYSPGAGAVTLSTDVRDGAVHLAVSDGGVGIPADQLERVFEPYARLEHEATQQVGGTGLGLPIVREILRLHGGTVWAESVVGHGSTFHCTLPLVTAEPAPEAMA